MKQQTRILVCGNSRRFQSEVPALLRGLRVECLVASEPEGASALLSNHTCAALISYVREYKSGGSHDLGFLRAVKSAHPGLQIIVIRDTLSDSGKLDHILAQFIVENRNVVLMPREQSDKLLSSYLVEIIGVEPAEGGEEFSVQKLIPIEKHISHGVLTSHFQPIVDLQSGEVYAYEALARSNSGGLLNHPGVLFEYAAKKTMFAAIDYACTQTALRESHGILGDQMLFLNVQPRSLADVNFPEILEFNAVMFGRKPSEICVELTEQDGVKSSRLFQTALSQFRDRGFQIAVDDFGEGNANFEMLLHVKPNVVKLSGRIVSELQKLPAARKILKSVTALCQDLGIQTVAEFVETEEQLQILTELGITFGQGWHLGRPVPASEIRKKTSEVGAGLL